MNLRPSNSIHTLSVSGDAGKVKFSSGRNVCISEGTGGGGGSKQNG